MPEDMEESNNIFGLEEGCPEHGSERMIECTACGMEFCTFCFPRSVVCADCAEDSGLEEEAQGGDFDDVDKLGKVLDDEAADERAKYDIDESP